MPGRDGEYIQACEVGGGNVLTRGGGGRSHGGGGGGGGTRVKTTRTPS